MGTVWRWFGLKKIVLGLILPLILVTGCFRKVTDEEFPKNPHLKGEVVSINEQMQGLYIEGEIEEDTLYDKAYTIINNETVIYIFEDGRGEIGVFSMIEEGDQVKVWFIGPVAESYPVRATAGKIYIYKD